MDLTDRATAQREAPRRPEADGAPMSSADGSAQRRIDEHFSISDWLPFAWSRQSAYFLKSALEGEEPEPLEPEPLEPLDPPDPEPPDEPEPPRPPSPPPFWPSCDCSSLSGLASVGAVICTGSPTLANCSENLMLPPLAPLACERLSAGIEKLIVADRRRSVLSSLATNASKVGSLTTSLTCWICSGVSFCVLAWPIAGPAFSTSVLMSFSIFSTSSVPVTLVVAVPATSSSPSSLASRTQFEGSMPYCLSDVGLLFCELSCCWYCCTTWLPTS